MNYSETNQKDVVFMTARQSRY